MRSLARPCLPKLHAFHSPADGTRAAKKAKKAKKVKKDKNKERKAAHTQLAQSTRVHLLFTVGFGLAVPVAHGAAAHNTVNILVYSISIVMAT